MKPLNNLILYISQRFIFALLAFPGILFGQNTITFETLAVPSRSGGLTLGNQFSDVYLNFPVALNYNRGFAHSGTKAIEICHGVEFCNLQLQMTFNVLQRHVKIWVGYDNILTSTQTVTIKAFDRSKNKVDESSISLGPSTSRIPVQNSLEVNTISQVIDSVTVSFVNFQNYDLVFDDLEYDNSGAVSSCPTTLVPALSVLTPVNGKIVLRNVFDIKASITTNYNFTDYPYSTFQITVSDINGNTKTYGPNYLHSFYLQSNGFTGNLLLNGLTGLLFPGENKLTVKITDCAGSTEISRTVYFRSDVVSTIIHVTDEQGANVPGAEVYAGAIFPGAELDAGKLLGKTNNRGMLTVRPPLEDKAELVARKLVYQKENAPDFNYKVYQTSMSVRNDGLVNPYRVSLEPDPTAIHKLIVRPRNALVAFQLKASLEWDASVAELIDIRKHFIDASQFMYNATDGQFIIEQVNIVDDKENWHKPPYRIYGNQSLRSEWKKEWHLGQFHFDSRIKMARPPRIGIDNHNSEAKVYIHEFGHYKFRLGDEYKDNTPGASWCTATAQFGITQTASSRTRFSAGSDAAACIMSNQFQAPKFCSSRPENPHIQGTRQGSASCWSTISNRFKDSQSPARWRIRIPDTRGAIPGAINNNILPVSGWTTHFNIQNRNRGALCEPIMFVKIDNNGNLLLNADIWLSTNYGQDILEGNTDVVSGAGIWCTGLHEGDKVGDYTITTTDCIALPPTHILPIHTSNSNVQLNADTSIKPSQKTITLVMSNIALGIRLSIEPIGMDGKYKIRVRMDSTDESIRESKLPTLLLSSSDGLRDIKVKLVYNAQIQEYVGITQSLPLIPDGRLKLIFEDNGKMSSAIENFVSMPVLPKQSLNLSSGDGKVNLELPIGVLPTKSRVTIGPAIIAPPRLDPGTALIIKPVNVAASDQRELIKEASLHFHLPSIDSRLGRGKYNLENLLLLRFNMKTQKWEKLSYTLVSFPIGELTCKTKQLGVFAIVATISSKEE